MTPPKVGDVFTALCAIRFSDYSGDRVEPGDCLTLTGCATSWGSSRPYWLEADDGGGSWFDLDRIDGSREALLRPATAEELAVYLLRKAVLQ